MILTTTNTVEGKDITAYLGIVTGIEVKRGYEKIKFKDSFKVNKYDELIEEQILTTKEEAFQKLTQNAQKMGADAVVGITVDVEVTSQIKVVISVVGTAVTIK